MTVAFAIPLKKPKDKQERALLDILLSLTLDSIAQQTSDDWIAVVCGHAAPRAALERHPNTKWLKAPFPAPEDSAQGRQDKHRKRAHIAAHLRRRHSSLYVMPLDGDDLVHRDLVSFTEENGQGAGVYFERGMALNFRSGEIAPVPGAWNTPFHQICGSSAVVRLRPSELPRAFDDPESRYFNAIQSHPQVVRAAAKRKRPLVPFPEPGAVYVLNHGTNLSYDLLAARRIGRVARRTTAFSVADPLETLRPYVDPERYLAARDAVALTF